MKRILLAGSTGYLGVYIVKELQQRSCFLRAIARNIEKLEKNDIKANEILKAELTDPESIKECWAILTGPGLRYCIIQLASLSGP